MAIVRMLHVALGVSEMARSLAFYRDVLGFVVLAEATLPAASGRALDVACDGIDAVLLRRDGLRLQLVRRVTTSEQATPPSALSHIAMLVDDLAATLHSLRDRGATVVAGTHSEYAPGVLSCLIRDPDGFAILLHQAPPGAASPWSDEDDA